MDHEQEKSRKLQSLKELKAKMKELHSHSLKSDSQEIPDEEPNPAMPKNEEASEDGSEMSHQSREDSVHDDMNEDHTDAESNLESHPEHDSEEVKDHMPPLKLHPGLAKLLAMHTSMKK